MAVANENFLKTAQGVGEAENHPSHDDTGDPVDHLSRLIQWLEEGGDLPTETALWLREGLRRYVDTPQTLDVALALSRGPKRSARFRYRMALRDAALRRAAALVILPSDRNHLQARAEALAIEVQRFSRSWPRLRKTGIDPQWSQLRRQLFEAFSACPVVPTSPRHLLRILEKC